eukprot:4830122-Amphidinium_carterae.1
MTGQAKLLAESITDQELISPQGLQLLIGHFDALYAGAMKVTAELDFDATLFSGSRQTGESFLAFVARKTIEFARYERGAHCQLPDQLKAKILLRQCKATEKQMQRLLAWLDGDRTETAVKNALGKLDTDLDVTLATSGGIDSRILWQADQEEELGGESEIINSESSAVLAELYSPEHDVGFDSDDESFVWIFHQDAEAELDDTELEAQFVGFAAVQRAKQAHKVARGWFAPQNYLKGKGKGKGLKTDDDFSNKGKEKGKRGDSKGRFGPQVHRDDRRRQSMMRVPISTLATRVRCWRCGQVGHMAKNCSQNYSAGNPGGHVQGAGGSPQSQGCGGSAGGASSRGSSKGYFVGVTWQNEGKAQAASMDILRRSSEVPEPPRREEERSTSAFVERGNAAAYFVTSPDVAVVDTGAVNGIVGVTQFEILYRRLMQVGLTVKIDKKAEGAPTNVGGIGGGAAVVCTAIVPTALDQIPGLMSFIIIITGEVPALLPLPLMKALGAILDLPGQCIHWNEHSGHVSVLLDLPTGHLGCSILDGIATWAELHPSAEDFQRSSNDGFEEENLAWVKQRARELMLTQNRKSAAHFVLEECDTTKSPPTIRSCLSSGSSRTSDHGLVESSSQARTMSTTEGTTRICDHLRPKRCHFLGEVDEEDVVASLHGKSASDDAGTQDSCIEGASSIKQHNRLSGNPKSRGVCEESTEQSERGHGLCTSRRMRTPSTESARECPSEMVLLHEVPEEVATQRRGVLVDGVKEIWGSDLELKTLEAQSLEEMFETEWCRPTLAECQCLTKSYFQIIDVPCVYQTTREEAIQGAGHESYTGWCRTLSSSTDVIDKLYCASVNSEVNVASVNSEVNVASMNSVVNVASVNPEVNVAPVNSEINVASENSEVKGASVKSEEDEGSSRTIFLLEQQGATAVQDGCLQEVWNFVHNQSRTPKQRWIEGTCVQAHARAFKGKTLEEPITIATPPYRLSILVQDGKESTFGGKVAVHIDRWACMGRKKRERKFGEQTEVVATVFFQSHHQACLFASWVSQTEKWNIPTWPTWMKVEEESQLDRLESLDMEDLLHHLCDLLLQRNMPNQHRPLEAVKTGEFSTFTLGASTQRGPMISKALRSGEWTQ